MVLEGFDYGKIAKYHPAFSMCEHRPSQMVEGVLLWETMVAQIRAPSRILWQPVELHRWLAAYMRQAKKATCRPYQDEDCYCLLVCPVVQQCHP